MDKDVTPYTNVHNCIKNGLCFLNMSLSENGHWQVSSFIVKNPPNWQGFMASIVHGTDLPSKIKFHPVVPLDPSSYEAVIALCHLYVNNYKKIRSAVPVLHLISPSIWKACEIKEDKSPELDNIHLKLGGFHQLMSFLGAGCKLMEDTGLRELWSTVYKENSLPKMMEGKACSRCLRACLLTDSALHLFCLQLKTLRVQLLRRFLSLLRPSMMQMR